MLCSPAVRLSTETTTMKVVFSVYWYRLKCSSQMKIRPIVKYGRLSDFLNKKRQTSWNRQFKNFYFLAQWISSDFKNGLKKHDRTFRMLKTVFKMVSKNAVKQIQRQNTWLCLEFSHRFKQEYDEMKSNKNRWRNLQ